MTPPFGGDGTVETDLDAAAAHAVAIQSDGKIVAAGTTSVGDSPKNFALARYHGGDGSPDGDFGDAGTVVTDFGGTEEAWGIALQRDGKIVAAGSSCDNGCDFALARYRPDGSVDTSFSGDGKVLTDFVGLGDGAYAVAIQPDDGKIVAIGYAHTFGVITGFALARYDTGPTDTTPPVIDGTVSPDPNSNGWHNGDVTLTWSVTDPESGIASSTCRGFTLSAETNGSIVFCTARNGAGLSASWSSVPIRIDRTAPGIECGVADGAWHADNVSIACTANDERSGLADAATASFSLATSVPAGAEDGNAATGSRTVCDGAGNCVTAGPVSGNKVDRKAPALVLPANLVMNAVSPSGEAVTFSATATDGADPNPVVGCSPPSGSTFAIGTTTVSCTASDAAGNSSSGTFTITINGAAAQIGQTAATLAAIVAGSPGTPLADKIEDALAALAAASQELEEQPPERQAALGALEGAAGDIEAAMQAGLLSAEQGTPILEQLTAAARLLAVTAIDEAIAGGGDAAKIAQSQQALAAGDGKRAAGTYKDAISLYKDALANAESA